MIAFKVPDMSCGHCVASITEALHSLDGAARVEIDLESRQVRVESTQAGTGALQQAIQDAGYTPELQGPMAAMPRTGCGCGGGGGGCGT